MRSSYYGIDGVYAIREFVNSLMSSGDIKLLSKVSPEANVEGADHYYGFIIGGECNNEIPANSYCNVLKNEYSINNLYVVKYEKKSLLQFKDLSLNNTFKDYVDFVISYYNFRFLIYIILSYT